MDRRDSSILGTEKKTESPAERGCLPGLWGTVIRGEGKVLKKATGTLADASMKPQEQAKVVRRPCWEKKLKEYGEKKEGKFDTGKIEKSLSNS